MGRLDSPTWLALGWSEEAGLRGRRRRPLGSGGASLQQGGEGPWGVSEIGAGVRSPEAPPWPFK